MTARNDGLRMARSVEATVLANAARAEEERTLPAETVAALWESGLMQWMNPREAGGSEPPLTAMIEVWIELGRQDGSVGWIGIANFPAAAFAAAYLPEPGFAEVFLQHNCRITVGGQFAPNGVGTPVTNGYEVSGAWQFGSGTGHAEFVVGGFIPMQDGEMAVLENGMPEMLVAVIPRGEIQFTDGWHVTGLKGTGSYDYNVEQLFVPAQRTFPLMTREPQRGGANFKLGIMPLTAAGHAGWALGVARSALDDVLQLAKEKTRMGDTSTLAHKLTFQRNLAYHEAQWRAARSLVLETFDAVAQQVAAGAALTPQMRADMRLAATFATEASREVVEFAHLAAGTTAIRTGSRLERAFRDIYTGSQHAFISEKTFTDAAQLMLGLIDDSPGL